MLSVLAPIVKLNSDVDTFFENTLLPKPFHEPWRPLRSPIMGPTVSGLPKLEVHDNKYLIRVETPGIKKDDLSIELVGRRVLVVSARQPTSSRQECTKSMTQDTSPDNTSPTGEETGQQESCVQLRKVVALPKEINVDDMVLSYADGVLRVEAAKKAADAAEPEDDEETKRLEGDLKRKRAALEQLRVEVAEARESVAEAESNLAEVRAAKRRKIAGERRQLLITQ